jgi:uncharacterized protein (DUF58 family)
MNEPFIKEFIEERDLTIYVVFDVSGSNEFGSNKAKKEAAIELSASIMFAALRNNDKIGLSLFTDRVERFVPARKGRKHVLRLIRELIYHEPESRVTDIKASLSYLASILKRRAIIFIVSDFLADDFSKPLKILKNRHDVIMVNINDEREMEIPDVGYIELEDEETGEQMLVNTSDPVFRKEYSKLVNRRYRKLENLMKKINIDMIKLRSDEAFEVPLRQFFKMRSKRR